ncbi:MAG: pantetheine-phosphate adenylyltransferase [Myxococcota bacterium]|nr:pantetheine-phosphate adenylyltransferase [Myxococcota bacterium]
MPLTALYPGSFDPFTNGHLGVTERALPVVDKLILGIARNARKRSMFTVEERIEMIRATLAHHEHVSVCSFEGLTVDFADACGASVIIRGLRAVADFEYELQMANMNRKLNPRVETLFMMTSEEYFFVSSQNVKEVARLDGNISGLVPPIIADRVLAKLNSQPKD